MKYFASEGAKDVGASQRSRRPRAREPVARALVAMAEAYRRGPLLQQDYRTVGRVLEELEVGAGTGRVPTGRRRSPD